MSHGISPSASHVNPSPTVLSGVAAMERLRGHHHVELVHNLRRRLDTLPDPKGTRLVILRGTSGQGKSRVIRELYRSLSTGDNYWPDLPGWDSEGDLRARKALGPDLSKFIWRADAVPTFAW